MTEVRIRRMNQDEADPVGRVIIAAIRAALPSRYPADVVAGLVAGNGPEAVAGHAPKQVDYVYEQDGCPGCPGRIVAMVGLKRNEIGHLFVDPTLSAKGIGRSLVNFAAEQFRQAGYSDMIVLSSLNAVGFYQRCGFVAEGLGRFSVGEGLPLVFVKMRAKL